MPGDSAMGLRLPLDSLPWVSKGDYPYLVETTPWHRAAALPDPAVLQARYRNLSSGCAPMAPAGNSY